MLARNPLFTWIVFAAILLLAAFLRFWQLDTLPPGLYHDEAYNGLDALSLLDGKTFPQFYEGWELYAADAHAQRTAEETRYPLFFEGNYGREPLHVYLMALSVSLFGATPFALRAVPAAALRVEAPEPEDPHASPLLGSIIHASAPAPRAPHAARGRSCREDRAPISERLTSPAGRQPTPPRFSSGTVRRMLMAACSRT